MTCYWLDFTYCSSEAAAAVWKDEKVLWLYAILKFFFQFFIANFPPLSHVLVSRCWVEDMMKEEVGSCRGRITWSFRWSINFLRFLISLKIKFFIVFPTFRIPIFFFPSFETLLFSQLMHSMQSHVFPSRRHFPYEIFSLTVKKSFNQLQSSSSTTSRRCNERRLSFHKT